MREVARLLKKHPGSVSRYLDRGWQLKTTEEFSALLKTIDHATRSSYNREPATSPLISPGFVARVAKRKYPLGLL